VSVGSSPEINQLCLRDRQVEVWGNHVVSFPFWIRARVI
jgi:hypothetical protein